MGIQGEPGGAGGGASSLGDLALAQGSGIIGSSGGVAAASPIGIQSLQGFRLTLEAGESVSDSDQSAKTTIYLTPHKHNSISFYDGTGWTMLESAEVELALGTLTDAKNYDVYAYNASGTLTLEFLVWTNDSTRATEIVRQDGVWCKTGALTRRYVGTFRTTATTTTEDSVNVRGVYNVDNQVRRVCRADGTGSHTYTTATWREHDGGSANSVRAEFVLGLPQSAVCAFQGQFQTSGDNLVASYGFFLDATNSANNNAAQPLTTSAIDVAVSNYVYSNEQLTAGYHFVAVTEQGGGSGTQTFANGGARLHLKV